MSMTPDKSKQDKDGNPIWLKPDKSKQGIENVIHNTREWQALHLEVQAEILENVKKGLAKAIKEYYLEMIGKERKCSCDKDSPVCHCGYRVYNSAIRQTKKNLEGIK